MTSEAIAAMIDQYYRECDPYSYDDANDSRAEGVERLQRLMEDEPETVAEDLREMVGSAADDAEASQGRRLLEMVQRLL